MTDFFQDMQEIYNPDSTRWPKRLRSSSRTTKGSRSRMWRYKITLAASRAACQTPQSRPAKPKNEFGQFIIQSLRRIPCAGLFASDMSQPCPPATPSHQTSICTTPAPVTQHHFGYQSSRAILSMALRPTGGWVARFRNSLTSIREDVFQPRLHHRRFQIKSTQATEGCRFCVPAKRYQYQRA